MSVDETWHKIYVKCSRVYFTSIPICTIKSWIFLPFFLFQFFERHFSVHFSMFSVPPPRVMIYLSNRTSTQEMQTKNLLSLFSPYKLFFSNKTSTILYSNKWRLWLGKILSCQSQSTFSQACPETRHSHIIYNILTCTSVKPHKIARKKNRKKAPQSRRDNDNSAHTVLNSFLLCLDFFNYVSFLHFLCCFFGCSGCLFVAFYSRHEPCDVVRVLFGTQEQRHGARENSSY